MAELGGEKVDIIEWSDDSVKFIANGLSPAKIINVELNEEEKEAQVGVLEDQLSLAIGKAGQNVRLAARLTGWKIDIVGEKLGDAGEVVEGEVSASASPEEAEEAPDSPPEEDTQEGQKVESDAADTVEPVEETVKEQQAQNDQPMVGVDTVEAAEDPAASKE